MKVVDSDATPHQMTIRQISKESGIMNIRYYGQIEERKK